MEKEVRELLNYVNDKREDYILYLSQEIPMIKRRHEVYRGKLEAYTDIKFWIEEILKPKAFVASKKHSTLWALIKAYENK